MPLSHEKTKKTFSSNRDIQTTNVIRVGNDKSHYLLILLSNRGFLKVMFWMFLCWSCNLLIFNRHDKEHQLGQRVSVVQKSNRWSDFQILSTSPVHFPFIVSRHWSRRVCNCTVSTTYLLSSHRTIKLRTKFFASIICYSTPLNFAVMIRKMM